MKIFIRFLYAISYAPVLMILGILSVSIGVITWILFKKNYFARMGGVYMDLSNHI